MLTNLFNENSEYVQSANTLFHFMSRAEFLQAALDRKGLVPRYCEENISYLGLKVNDRKQDTISVLQKCFCDMPFHKLTERFQIIIEEEDLHKLSDAEKEEAKKYNTHTEFYGKYAIAFSKQWSEKHNLQPVHYLNSAAEFSDELKLFLEYALNIEDLPDELYEDVLNRLSFIKPLRGEMVRTLSTGNSVHFTKNFHDEKEWRYVPSCQELRKSKLERVIAKPMISEKRNKINREIETFEYNNIWLKFEYDDIKYLIVPSAGERIDLINHINSILEEQFREDISTDTQKGLLISRILVLDEIRGDW